MTTPEVDLASDVTFSAFVQAAKAEMDAYRDVDARYVAATGDAKDQIEAFMEGSQDEKAQRFRQAQADLLKNFREYAESQIQTVALSEEEKTKLTTERTQKRTEVQTVLKGLKSLAQSLTRTRGQDYVGSFEKWLESVGGDPTTRKGGGGSSLPKVPATVTITIPAKGDNPEQVKEFDNFTQASKWWGDPTAEQLQKATAQAASLEHSALSQLAEPVTFTRPRGELTLTVTVTPKAKKTA